MKTIAIINLKGGVGKTTTAISMAHLLKERYKKRVLLIDNDPQGNASQFCEKYSAINDGCGSGCILQNVRPAIWKSENTGLDIINANMTLLEADNELRASADRQDNRMAEYLKTLEADYDFCIIDNPPAILMCTINALCAADEVIIQIMLDNWALDGAEVITGQIEEMKALNPRLRIAGILLTNYRKTAENEAAEKWLRQNAKYRVFQTQIRRSEKVTAATYYKKPIEEYSPRSAAAVSYRKFVNEYLQEREGKR